VQPAAPVLGTSDAGVPSSSPSSPSSPSPDRAVRHRRGLALAGLALVAFLASLAVHRYLLPRLSGNRDEGVYLYQARLLLHGRLTLPAGRYGAFFRPWLTGERNGRLFTEYQLGFPAALAGFLLVLGSVHLGLALVAALTVPAGYGFADELLDDKRVALAAAAFLTLSPIFLLHSGLVLTYGLTILAALTAGWAALRGARLGSTPLLLTSGLAMGAVVLTRPEDAILVGLPLVVLLVIRLHRVGRLDTLRRAVPAGAVGVVIAIAVTLWYNARTTGSALDFPNTTADPLNTFGFGLRRLILTDGPFRYDVGMAVSSLWANVRAVPSWLLGGPLVLLLAAVGLWPRDRRAERLTLLAIALAFPVGYFFWYATALSGLHATNGIGPHYYLPSIVALLVLAAAGAVRLATRPAFAVVLAAALVGATAWAIPDKLADARKVTHDYRVAQTLVPPHLDHALVFLAATRPYLLWDQPFLQNAPDLSGRIVYALDRGPRDAALLAQMPGRIPYRLRPALRPGDPVGHPTGGFERLAVVQGPRLRIGASVGDLPAGAWVRVSATIGGTALELPPAITDGRARSSGAWVVAPGPARAAGDIALDGGPGTVTPVVLIVEASTSPDFAVSRRWRMQLPVEVEADGSLLAVTPGLGSRLAETATGAAWLPADVSPVLRVDVRPA